jgi:CDGSH-type Zn-finger protein
MGGHTSRIMRRVQTRMQLAACKRTALANTPPMETLPKIHDKQPVAVELPAGDHWCDGSHKGTGFGPKKFTLPEAKKVWLCNCKQTKNPPFCDGSHKAL